MSDQAFLAALQKITAGTLSLGELINEAGGLIAAGQKPLAQELYKIWISFGREHPQRFVAHYNLSGLLTETGDLAGAAEQLKAALALNAEFLPGYINLGGVFDRAGARDQAMEQWRAALARLAPVTGQAVGYKVAALKQIARVLVDTHQTEGAEPLLREALSLNPNQRDVMEQFLSLRLSQCRWPVMEPWEEIDRKTLVASVHPLSMGAYTDDPLLQLAAASRYVDRAVKAGPSDGPSDRRDAPIDLSSRRLRVGYVSSDLRDHAVGYLMAELFELHDRSKVEVFAYYCGIPSTEGLTTRIQGAIEHWTDIRSMTDEEAAQKIAADGIDILVDVNGHTRDSRTGVFARRPAPVQVNWLGYPGTMGSPYHHYMVADPWIIPPEFELYYSEKVLRLPCYQPNDRKRAVSADPPTRAQFGLPEDGVVFCCFNGTQKITRFTFERWVEILKRTPGSVLWLLDTTPETNKRLSDMAESYGLDRSRLVFAPKLANAYHLARYPLADLFLDTVPYGAHTTASDALWMGVPVLTLSGRCFASRVCGSLVRSAGLPELVCETPRDYVERAVALAHDRPQLAALKAKLQAGRDTCDLFNMDQLVACLEDLYGEMCLAHGQGALPQPNLANLETYFDIGTEFDHEGVELLAVDDYHGLYKTGLEQRHRARPMRPDGRLWTAGDIAAVEQDFGGNATPLAAPRKRAAG